MTGSDLRASAAMVLAGLPLKAPPWCKAQHLDRGYDRLEEKLRSVGASIASRRWIGAVGLEPTKPKPAHLSRCVYQFRHAPAGSIYRCDGHLRPLPCEVGERAKGFGCVTAKAPLPRLRCGIATCTLGHSDRALRRASTQQLRKLQHVSNLYAIGEQEQLASWIAANSCCDQVFFCNSGAEANEAAIKLARKYGHSRRGISQPLILTARSSFHGRTWRR